MKKKLSKTKLREFGLFIGFAFPLLIGLILPSLQGHSFRVWTLYIRIPSLILAIFRPEILIYPYNAWMKIGYILGWINSRIILALVFLIVLQPIALIMRVLGHDPLNMKMHNKKSYREFKTNKKVNFNKIF